MFIYPDSVKFTIRAMFMFLADCLHSFRLVSCQCKEGVTIAIRCHGSRLSWQYVFLIEDSDRII